MCLKRKYRQRQYSILSGTCPLILGYSTSTSQKLGSNGGKIKRSKPTLYYRRIPKPTLTRHLFNVHLPPLVRIVDLPKLTHHLQYHLASHLVLELKESGMSSRILWRYVGESGRRPPYGHGHSHASEHSTPTRQFCLGHCEKAVEGEFTV